MGTNFFEIWGAVLGIFLVMPIVASATITVLSAKSNSELQNRFGENAPVWFGWLGVIVHELSHALMSLIFFHKIDDMRLLQSPFAKGRNGQLGYVSHAWTPGNWYQQAGNFFIGLAPIFGISVVGWLLTLWWWPALFQVHELGWSIFTRAPWWLVLIWVYVMMNLWLGLNLSSADWHNARTGLLTYGAFLSVVSVGLNFIVTDALQVWQAVGLPILIFYIGLIGLSFIVFVLTTLLHRI
jgi:hypothetical protein